MLSAAPAVPGRASRGPTDVMNILGFLLLIAPVALVVAFLIYRDRQGRG